MADVSGARNFWGRVVDGILPGNQYDRQTGQFSNIGSGIAGFVGNQFAPGLGTVGARLWQGGGLNGLFRTNPAINQMANPQGHGYDLRPWAGIGLPPMGSNPFTPTGGGSGGAWGGLGRTFTFGGYQSPEHREASIQATQQAMQDARNATPNNRQLNNYAS